VADEVEIYLQHPYAVGHGQRGEAADGGIEGDVPRVVDRRHKGEANLAHDLEPKLERGAGIAPLSLRKRRPDLCGGRGRCGRVWECWVHSPLVGTSYLIGTVSKDTRRRPIPIASRIFWAPRHSFPVSLLDEKVGQISP